MVEFRRFGNAIHPDIVSQIPVLSRHRTKHIESPNGTIVYSRINGWIIVICPETNGRHLIHLSKSYLPEERDTAERNIDIIRDFCGSLNIEPIISTQFHEVMGLIAAQESENTKYLTLSAPTNTGDMNDLFAFLEHSSFQMKHHVQSTVRSLLTTDDLVNYINSIPFLKEYGLSITKQVGSEIILSGSTGWKYSISLNTDKQVIDMSFVATPKPGRVWGEKFLQYVDRIAQTHDFRHIPESIFGHHYGIPIDQFAYEFNSLLEDVDRFWEGEPKQEEEKCTANSAI